MPTGEPCPQAEDHAKRRTALPTAWAADDLLDRLDKMARLSHALSPYFMTVAATEAALKIRALMAENFVLAAGQCAEATSDDGGTPRCKRIENIEAKRRLHKGCTL